MSCITKAVVSFLTVTLTEPPTDEKEWGRMLVIEYPPKWRFDSCACAGMDISIITRMITIVSNNI